MRNSSIMVTGCPTSRRPTSGNSRRFRTVKPTGKSSKGNEIMSEPTSKTCGLVDERDQQCCVVCGMSLYAVSGSRHHRRPRSHKFGGLHLPANLILVCGSGTTGCHGKIHANPAWAYQMGYLVHSWDTPEKVPLKHHEYGWCLLDENGGYRTLSQKDMELIV